MYYELLYWGLPSFTRSKGLSMENVCSMSSQVLHIIGRQRVGTKSLNGILHVSPLSENLLLCSV